MQQMVKGMVQCTVLFWLLAGFGGIIQAQTLSSSPDPSAGVQYVAPTCSGGVPCTRMNDGLSPGSAKWDTDAGRAINDAYAALPTTGGVIYVLSLHGCSNFSTPIVLNTNGKYVTIIGTGVNTTCLNYTPSAGTALTLATGNAGIGQNDRLENFSLRTNAVGSTAEGLVVGSNNLSASFTKLDGMSIYGFQYDLIDNTYGLVLTNTNLLSCSSASNSVAFQTATSGLINGDDTRIHASEFQGCATLLRVGNLNPVWADGLILANAGSTWVDVPIGGVFCNRCHWFNQSGTANWFTNGGGNLIISNSQFEDGASTGTSTSYATETAGFTSITDSVLFSAGHSVTEFLNVTSGNVFLENFANTSQPLIPRLTNGGFSDPYARTVLYSGPFTTGHVLTAQVSGPSFYVQDGGGVPVLQGPNGLSAGSCTISGGQCSHSFANPYNSAPVCTASSTVQIADPPAVSASSAAVTVTDVHAFSGAVINWICYPVAN